MFRTSAILRATVAAVICLGSCTAVQSQGLVSELEASLRLGLEARSQPQSTINFQDFASRVRWNALLDINESSSVTGYLEFGFDEDSGLANTRQAWIGYSADFGTLKGGKQYRAFYDVTSSFTDIAYVGSCLYQIGCRRQEALIKYERLLDETTRIVASGTMQNGDEGDDLFDELEGGGIFTLGDITLGAIAGFRASEGPNDTGLALGVALSTELNGVKVSSSVQFADADYARTGTGTGNDDVLLLNAAASVKRWYAIAGLQSADNTPFYATIGYEYPIVDDALMYAELQALDPDGNDDDGDGLQDDVELFLRTVFVYDFGAVSQ